jgi:hypothetical protein
VAAVASPRLPEFFEDVQKAFIRAEEEDDVVPVRMFYRQWAVVEIERHPVRESTVFLPQDHPLGPLRLRIQGRGTP